MDERFIEDLVRINLCFNSTVYNKIRILIMELPVDVGETGDGT